MKAQHETDYKRALSFLNGKYKIRQRTGFTTVQIYLAG